MATVARKRVLVTGMGGELGTRVAALLEDQAWVGDLVGADIDPPRGRLRRTRFERIDPRDRRRTVELVTAFDAHVVRAPRRLRAQRQGGAGQRRRPHRGRRSARPGRGGRGPVGRGDHRAVRASRCTAAADGPPPGPTKPCLSTRRRRSAARSSRSRSWPRAPGVSADVPVTLLRLAPVLGPHVPSPLGRFLRLPVGADRPVGRPADGAAPRRGSGGRGGRRRTAARGRAGQRRRPGRCHAAPGRAHGQPPAVAWCSARRGGSRGRWPRLRSARRSRLTSSSCSAAVGSPTAVGPPASSGSAPSWPTDAVVKELYRWASVTRLPAFDGRGGLMLAPLGDREVPVADPVAGWSAPSAAAWAALHGGPVGPRPRRARGDKVDGPPALEHDGRGRAAASIGPGAARRQRSRRVARPARRGPRPRRGGRPPDPLHRRRRRRAARHRAAPPRGDVGRAG